jgi:hypothetical protein
MDYQEFLEAKKHSLGDHRFDNINDQTKLF